MRLKFLIQITDDEGVPGELQEIVSLSKGTEGPEDLGLTLADGKTMLAVAQQRLVESQV